MVRKTARTQRRATPTSTKDVGQIADEIFNKFWAERTLLMKREQGKKLTVVEKRKLKKLDEARDAIGEEANEIFEEVRRSPLGRLAKQLVRSL
jgi:hypothetical protein